MYFLGSALYIETQAIRRGTDPEGKPRGGGTLKVTGQLGSVMKESTEIAYTVSRAHLANIDPSSQFFDVNDIHMHVPEGATPKDGPSAGVTMVRHQICLKYRMKRFNFWIPCRHCTNCKHDLITTLITMIDKFQISHNHFYIS